MAKAREIARSGHIDGILARNEDVFENNLTVPVNYNMVLAGPVTIPNVTVNGNLNVVNDIDITGDLNVGTNGSLNVIG